MPSFGSFHRYSFENLSEYLSCGGKFNQIIMNLQRHLFFIEAIAKLICPLKSPFCGHSRPFSSTNLQEVGLVKWPVAAISSHSQMASKSSIFPGKAVLQLPLLPLTAYDFYFDPLRGHNTYCLKGWNGIRACADRPTKDRYRSSA